MSAVGQLTVSQLTVSQLAVGQLAVEQLAVSQLAVSQLPVEQLAVSQLAVGWLGLCPKGGVLPVTLSAQAIRCPPGAPQERVSLQQLRRGSCMN